MNAVLQFAWKIRFGLWAEGSKLYAEGDKLRAEGSKLWAEGDKLRAEGSKLYAEGDKLRAKGSKLWAEGDKLWVEAIISVYGNIKLKWKSDTECLLENGEIYSDKTTVENNKEDEMIVALEKAGRIKNGKIVT